MKKSLKHGQTRALKRQAQNNIYQPRPPQGTSDIARGLDLINLNTKRESKGN